jgi:hypothetical protein
MEAFGSASLRTRGAPVPFPREAKSASDGKLATYKENS